MGLLHIQFSVNTNSCTLTKLYLNLIRPHLEYGAKAWHPYLSKDIQAIQNVQKFALRICSRNWNLSYWELLDMFQLPSLENRRLYLSLSTFYKIIYNLVSFPPHHLPTPYSFASSRHNHQCQYHTSLAHSNQLKHSFLRTYILLWNNLPIDSVNCTMYVAFKSHTAPLFI